MKRSGSKAGSVVPTRRANRWRARAEALAEQLPRAALHPAALAAIEARPAGEPIAIACSGGADSVALLLALWAHVPGRRKSAGGGGWRVLHFNHRLRGRAADRDAAFVRALATQLEIPCAIGVWTDRPRDRRTTSEGVARAARWRFFSEEMQRAGCRAIALGHQADDVVETMLMRLARGSGTAGLAAPRPVQRMADGTQRIRPLLAISAARLRDALRAAGAPWREDATNEAADFFRNRMRHRVVPALAQACADRDFRAGFTAARAQLEDDDAALESWLDELLPADSSAIAIGERLGALLRARPIALVRRGVIRWLAAHGLAGGNFSRSAVEQLVSAIRAGEEVRLSAGPTRFVVAKSGRLRVESAEVVSRGSFASAWPDLRLELGGEVVGPRGDRLSARRRRLTPKFYEKLRAGGLPAATVVAIDPGPDWDGGFDVRAWQPGDRYRPLGLGGRAKLQDLFTNRKIPRHERGLLPVICLGGRGVIWAPGLPPAAGAAVRPSSKLVVQLTYTPASNNVDRLNPETR